MLAGRGDCIVTIFLAYLREVFSVINAGVFQREVRDQCRLGAHLPVLFQWSDHERIVGAIG